MCNQLTKNERIPATNRWILIHEGQGGNLCFMKKPYNFWVPHVLKEIRCQDYHMLHSVVPHEQQKRALLPPPVRWPSRTNESKAALATCKNMILLSHFFEFHMSKGIDYNR